MNPVWVGPIDMTDFLCPETPEFAEVCLSVYTRPYPSNPRDAYYWTVSWEAPTNKSLSPYRRYLSLHSVIECKHQIYFGPMTKTVFDMPCTSFPLGNLSKDTRDKLEAVAQKIDVHYPGTNDGWVSVDWVEVLLRQAGKEGVLDEKKVEDALVAAKNLPYS